MVDHERDGGHEAERRVARKSLATIYGKSVILSLTQLNIVYETCLTGITAAKSIRQSADH